MRIEKIKKVTKRIKKPKRWLKMKYNAFYSFWHQMVEFTSEPVDEDSIPSSICIHHTSFSENPLGFSNFLKHIIDGNEILNLIVHDELILIENWARKVSIDHTSQ